MVINTYFVKPQSIP